MTVSATAAKRKSGKRSKGKLSRTWDLYILLIPALILLVVFAYGPMYGVAMAFQDFSPVKGIEGSPWVGLKHFERFVTAYNFGTLLGNTLTISIYSLIAGFPFPVVLALLVNKLRSHRFQTVVKTVSYAPYFISTVVLVGMLRIFLAPDTGFVNHIIEAFGGESFDFFASAPGF